jgi:hypothetical protein
MNMCSLCTCLRRELTQFRASIVGSAGAGTVLLGRSIAAAASQGHQRTS